jgi:hypothetical protein
MKIEDGRQGKRETATRVDDEGLELTASRAQPGELPICIANQNRNRLSSTYVQRKTVLFPAH